MKKRLIALLLCLVMLVTCMGVGVFLPPDIKLLDASSGEEVSSVSVPQSDRVQLTMDYKSSGEPGYQWQLSADGKTWINIYGQTGESVQLSYAMVCNMLNDEGTVQVRCMVTDGESEYASRAAEVSVDYSAPARPAQAAKAPASVAPVSDPAPASEGEDPELFNICINYIYGSGSKRYGEPASEQSVATVSYGGSFTEKVTFPTVVGYAAYFEDATEPSTEYQFNLENIKKNQTFNVYYQPATVNYTVKHFLQNLEDDEYTVDASRTKVLQGTTEQLVPDNLSDQIAGFTSLLYERTEIAADGSTEIEIYYDRNYCLLSFDLGGGWGVEPIYARYGTLISIDETALKKTGYTFDGWETPVPSEMPAENTICKAKWKQNNTAKVTVVVWGENANDEGYSYQDSYQLDAKPGTELKQTDLNGKLICGKEEHTHSASCYGGCTHQHNFACWGGVQLKKPSNNDLKKFTEYGLVNGNVYRLKCDAYASNPYDAYYLYYGGEWYSVNSNAVGTLIYESGAINVHGHTNYVISGNNKDYFYVYNSKLACTHTHSASCLNCGKEAHTHSSDCYYNANTMDSKLWTLVRSDEVTVAADGSTVMNLYYDRTEFTLTFMDGKKTVATIKDKWGADIKDKFPIVGNDGKNYKGYWWKVPSGSITYTAGKYLLSIDAMPKENITFSGTYEGTNAKLYYYVEKLDGETANAATDKSLDGISFKLYKPVIYTEKDGTLTEKEEFYEIPGFTKYKSDPSFAGGNPEPKNDNYFYYTRNDYTLKFFNRFNGYVQEKSVSVQYEAPLKQYYFDESNGLAYPSGLEANAYNFEGWYTTAGCVDGTKVDWNTFRMPVCDNENKDLVLYAKWVPKRYEVKVWLDSDQSSIIQVSGKDSQTVTHGNFASAPEGTPVNGAWDFIGWFYKDAQGNEKAFDFDNIPVKQDLNIYAKWGSKQPREFTVYYKALIDNNEVEIANPTKGSAIPGKTKTFYAKTGDNLNEAYREAFFPDASSKSLTVDVDPSKNVVIFWYTQKNAVPYTVKYVYEDGTNVFPDKVVDDNRKVVVTENALKKPGYLPDAIQKTLILSADGPNVIKFVYKADTEHAYYTRTHYLEDVNGNFTIKRDYFEAVGNVGETYRIDPNDYKGFTYAQGHSGELKSGKLTLDGLDLQLYYTRNSYAYTVKYLNKETLKELSPAMTREPVKFGRQVTESAITIPGYTVDMSQKNAIISTDEGKNVITFYYTENTATINYAVVGPEGCGSVTPGSETVKVLTGEAHGSKATVSSPNYKFVGWYSDEACTKHVDPSWVDSDNKLTPGKTETYGSVQGYKSATYYAKFDYNVVDLTITKTISGKDSQQLYGERSFVFHVKGIDENTERIDIDVVVKIENGQTTGSVVLKALPIGSYTITEDTGWSWRYGVGNVGFTGVSNHSNTGATASCTLVGGKDNAVTFTNSWLHAQWLSFTTSVQNIFGNK